MKRSFNPILPPQYCIPDVELRIFDERVYLYGSFDEPGAQHYCSTKYHIFSSTDLVEWQDHGVCFDSQKNVPWSCKELYAPDCIEKNGKYYLYFCTSDGDEGVAESDFPFGEFKNVRKIQLASGIDPAIFIDDDDEVYYFWGQFDNVRCAKLDQKDMATITTHTIKQPLSVAEHNFHEGASVRKINDTYYLAYTDTGRHGGKATCISYATATSPQGPYTYRGVLVDNYGCDKSSWNNHGSIAKVGENWYVVYHRSSGGTKYSRRVCVEKLTLNQDGSFDEAQMTSMGFGGTIDAKSTIPAYTACLLQGEVMFTSNQGIYALTGFENDDVVGYKYLEFSDSISCFCINIACETEDTLIDILQDLPNGNLIGTLRVPNTGGLFNYVEVSCFVGGYMRGKHALFLKVRGAENKELCRIKSLRFK